MRMIEIDYEAQPPIDSYGPGGFRVNNVWYDGGLLMLADGAHSVGEVLTLDTLGPALAAANVLDVLLIGQGPDIAPLAAPLRKALEDAELGYEVMSTPSACRTYNVLLTEDRRVGALLIPV